MTKLAWFLATGFGIGYLPMPGTCATLILGLPAAYLWEQCIPKPHLYVCLMLITLGCIGIIHHALRTTTVSHADPPEIVLDEIVAVLWVFAGVPINAQTVAIGTILFRLLDIIKPFPVSTGEQLPGAYGIVTDDIIAAVITNIVIRYYT